MNAKEKADELIDKMYYVGRYDDKEDYNPAMAWERAKQCALMAVDEMIIQNGELYLLGLAKDYYIEKNAYLFDVKSELQSL
tara:strand:- start:1669 stop:1911 length:243 start_codon:yes stop_codon:yes gene_type:complete